MLRHLLCSPHRRTVLAIVLAGTFVPGVSAQMVVVDNVDAGFTILSGIWDIGSYPTPHGADYRWALTSGYDPGEPYAEVEWRPNLPVADVYEVAVWYVSGTNRANDVTFTVHHLGGSTPVEVNQQIHGSSWNVLGAFAFGAGTAGSVTVTNSASASVVIADAVRFTGAGGVTVDLTMAVAPIGAGTTSPAAGSAYPYYVGQDAAISAAPADGYLFDHWQVSGGAAPANPTGATTTVPVDEAKTVTAVFTPVPSTQWRGFWADAFHEGYKSTAQIDELVALAVAGNYNAIIPEVLAYHDNVGSGHGAYWDSSIVPKASDIVGGFDPLAYLVQQAHAADLEVHCWLVSFRASSSWPPSGNALLAAHPEWIMVPRSATGFGPVTVDGKYTLDPGSADVQDYLISIVEELANNYAIDGIHWDYIRYTDDDAGYPADGSYANSGLARFRRLTNRSDLPDVNDGQWDDFRRRSITEFIRRAMAVTATADNPRQPLRHTAALITWGDAPSSFSNTSSYNLFQDWRTWMDHGYLDAGIPMTYYREHNPPHDQWYRNWVDASIGWRDDRHIFTGPGIYLNSFANSVAQMQYAVAAGVNGVCTYAYTSTNNTGVDWFEWYNYAALNVFTTPADPPVMPWREPTMATEGAVHGRVADGATGLAIDDAVLLVNGVDSGVRSDANGYFLLTELPVAAPGAPIAIGARYPGYADVVRPSVWIDPAGFTEANLGLGDWIPGDHDVDGDFDLVDYARFHGCLSGPAVAPAAGCDVFDVDGDGDVDLQDWGALMGSFTG